MLRAEGTMLNRSQDIHSILVEVIAKRGGEQQLSKNYIGEVQHPVEAPRKDA